MPDDDRAAYIRALVAHRCEEIGPADLALIGTIHPGATAEPDLPVEIGRDIMSVLAAMEFKLDALVEAIGDGDADDLAG
jgi:hypothetical protein